MRNFLMRKASKGGLAATFLLVLFCYVSACVAQNYARAPEEDGFTGRRTVTAANGCTDLLLELQISGGLTGRNQRLSVDVSGGATFTDNRARASRTLKLRDEQLERIRTLLIESEMYRGKDLLPGLPGRCRDCLAYKLLFKSDSKPLVVVISTVSLASSPFRALVEMLSAIAAEINGEGR